MEVNGSTPKEIEYIRKIRDHFSQSWTRRLKEKLSRSNDRYSRSELAEIIDNKNSDYAYQFLEKLIQEDVLQEAGRREHSSGGVTVYSYQGNKQLLKALSTTEFYKENRDLFVNTLEAAENKELL
jgi:hypothetical protein